MPAQIIDGEAVAAAIREELTKEIEALKAAGRVPHLHAVQVGENPASRVYIKSQKRNCEELGIQYTLDELPEDSTQEQVLEFIEGLNADAACTGIILQMPLPPGCDARAIQSRIAAHKDVEGMNPANMGRLLYGNPKPGPCTAVGAVELIKRTGVDITGKPATVVGHSEIVGKPIALLLLALNATTSVVHVFTDDIRPYVEQADVLVVAAGKSQAMWLRYRSALKKHKKNPDKNARPELPDLSPLVPGAWVKPGAIVIDVAINRIPAGFDESGDPVLSKKGKPKMKTVGDVEYEAASERAGYITPVPGGVGPLTVAMLLKNTVECAKLQQG
jgi:methylenetetrahydrofolate dehydrogenase (NADP+)/methenyltetrahydrofolate cyclohydrolase